MLKRIALAALLLSSVGQSSAFVRGGATLGSGGANAPTTFEELKIGAGGFLRDVSMAASTGVLTTTRTDTAGGYYYNPSIPNPGNAGGTGAWQQIVTATSIPASDFTPGEILDTWEMVAYSSTIFYQNYKGNIYVTTNSGATWAKGTGFTTDNIGASQTYSYLIFVDPQNADNVFAGSAGTGLYHSTNGTSGASSSWSLISTGQVPAGNQIGGCFDPTSSVVSSKKQGVYVWSQGHGVYHSTDGGTTFSSTPATNMPTAMTRVRCDAVGNVWVQNDGSSSLWKFNGTSWSVLSPSLSPSGMAVNPTSTSNIYVVDGSGNLAVSTNGGTSWNNLGTQSRSATDIPWLASAPSSSTGSIDFDASGNLWYAEGIGIWKLASPPTIGGTAYTWVSVSTAIEQLVGNKVLADPNGNVNFFSWDRSALHSASRSLFPTTTSYTASNAVPIVFGSGADYATGAPGTLAFVADSNIATFSQSGTSPDGGVSWTLFGVTSSSSVAVGTGSKVWTVSGLSVSNGDTIEIFRTSNQATWMLGTVTSYVGSTLTVNVTNLGDGSGTFTDWTVYTRPMPPNIILGGIAAGGATNFVWAPDTFDGTQQGSHPRYTTDGGVTWTNLASYFNTNFSVPTGASDSGFGGSYFNNQQIVCADRVNANTFYIYNSSASGTGGGVYRSTTSGASWTKRFTGPTPGGIQAGSFAKIKAVPGNAGHLFMTSNLNPDPFIRSTDGGATWSSVGSLNSVNAFGFGAAFPGQSYPAIYVAGYNGSNSVKANYGIWRSIDGGTTWTQLTNYPVNQFFLVTDLDGDKVTYGTVYGSFQGAGGFYGHL